MDNKQFLDKLVELIEEYESTDNRIAGCMVEVDVRGSTSDGIGIGASRYVWNGDIMEPVPHKED